MSFLQANVLSFESRRQKEMGELVRINGGVPFVAPALMEVPLTENDQAFSFFEQLRKGQFDMMIFLTGVGARYLQQVLATREPEEEFRQALRRVTVVVRGPKPMAVMKEWQIPVTVQVPEPNTYRELLEAIKDRKEKSVALQEYGKTNRALVEGLQAQGRAVVSVPVYQWRLPPDTQPLSEALQGLLTGRFQVAMFTTGVQLEHLLQLAAERNESEAMIEALHRMFIASIGPTCSETLRENGLEPNVEPSHPKMGILVREAALEYARLHAQSTSFESSAVKSYRNY